MSRAAWIVVGVVGWTVLLGLLGLSLLQQNDVLPMCGLVLPFDEAECRRYIAEMTASFAQARRVDAIVVAALWVGGLIVAGAFSVREISVRRVRS